MKNIDISCTRSLYKCNTLFYSTTKQIFFPLVIQSLQQENETKWYGSHTQYHQRGDVKEPSSRTQWLCFCIVFNKLRPHIWNVKDLCLYVASDWNIQHRLTCKVDELLHAFAPSLNGLERLKWSDVGKDHDHLSADLVFTVVTIKHRARILGTCNNIRPLV